MFPIITVVALAALAAVLSFHRFLIGRPAAGRSVIYGDLAKGWLLWLRGQARTATGKGAPAGWVAWLRCLRVWRMPPVERAVFIVFYASFLTLAGTGLACAVFIPRGLYGFPLLAHVTAGGLFAVSLAVIVLLRGKDYLITTVRFGVEPSSLDPRNWGVTVPVLLRVLFWFFVLAGFTEIVTAVVPMLPLLHTPGQTLMLEAHRYGALASTVVAILIADLSLLKPKS